MKLTKVGNGYTKFEWTEEEYFNSFTQEERDRFDRFNDVHFEDGRVWLIEYTAGWKKEKKNE